jgi:hypothetical protein
MLSFVGRCSVVGVFVRPTRTGAARGRSERVSASSSHVRFCFRCSPPPPPPFFFFFACSSIEYCCPVFVVFCADRNATRGCTRLKTKVRMFSSSDLLLIVVILRRCIDAMVGNDEGCYVGSGNLTFDLIYMSVFLLIINNENRCWLDARLRCGFVIQATFFMLLTPLAGVFLFFVLVDLVLARRFVFKLTKGSSSRNVNKQTILLHGGPRAARTTATPNDVIFVSQLYLFRLLLC